MPDFPEPRLPRRPQLKPSDWSPRPIPQPVEPRRTADPPTPTLKQLAERERQRALLVAEADAPRTVPRPATHLAPSAPAEPQVPHRPLSLVHNTQRPVATALSSNPLGHDRLTAEERRRLGDLCQQGDCSKVQVYRGDGTEMANGLRSDILKISQGRSVTLGMRIFLSDRDRDDFAVLAHEVEHTVQYQRWGTARYFVRGAGERMNEWTGGHPYGYKVDGRPFDQYGMEQQGQIIEDYANGRTDVRSIPGLPRLGP